MRNLGCGNMPLCICVKGPSNSSNTIIRGQVAVGSTSEYSVFRLSPGCQSLSVLQKTDLYAFAKRIPIMDFPVPGGPCKYTTV
jgi:hypothetical protein